MSAIGRMRPGELTEAASPLSRATRSEKSRNRGTISPSTVLDTIERHVLLDGFRIVVDLEKSRGSYLYNAVDDRRLIDLYGFFGSMPVGFNHPHFDDPQVQRDLLRAAKVKIANSDVYSDGYAIGKCERTWLPVTASAALRCCISATRFTGGAVTP